MIPEYITSLCHAWSVAIYSNMTHFTVGHIDEFSVHSNGDSGDSKWTRTWKMVMDKKKLQRDWHGMSNPDNPTIMTLI